MSGIAEIVPLTHETLGERIYLQLREMLICGQFAPGETVTIRSLAEAIGTSPMPVRDALRQLMVDQAIELLPKRSFRVPLMSRARFLELRDIRLAVEGLAAERAARAIRPAALKDAKALCEAFDKACDAPSPDPSRLVLLNKKLHFTIYESADMPALLQIISGLWTQIGPVLNLDVRQGSKRIADRVPCRHHGALVAALAARSPADARDALAADLNSAADHILAQDAFTP